MKKSNTDLNGVLENGTAGLSVRRPVYQLEDLNRDTDYETPHTTFVQDCGRRFRAFRPFRCLYYSVPVLKWLPKYSCKKNIFGDIISGITVAIMHIPQGMAYGLLGNVPPVVGIYMAFFPVLIYFIFGTSRHVSIGTFAIICLMTGKVVNQYSSIEILQNGTVVTTPSPNPEMPLYTNVEVATTVTFAVAMIQLVMYSLRLGVVSTLLSETLVNGFTCASAFHVVSSQIKDLFGIPIKKRRGNFGFPLTIYDSVLALSRANPYACGMSAVSCVILIINNEVLKPFLAKKTKIPFPIELLAVVLGTASSYFFSLDTKYDISVVGHIPTGFPAPTPPAFALIPDILVDAFVITMVSYTITMSMALIFARKLFYEVDSNQELLALGLSNTMGSFFACMPVTASLSRSMIQEAVGGVTQIASIVSCSILLVILLWIGPLFETLPRCVLASIIVVALKGMLFQCQSIVRYWKLSKWDALVWTVTFCTTLFVQIGYGLAAGVAVSLLSVFIQGYKPYTCLLGVVPNTDLYLDIKRYKKAQEIQGVKIFRYSGGLSFASRSAFKELLNRKIGFDPASVLRKRARLEESPSRSTTVTEDFDLLTRCVILDFASLTFVDPSGVDLLRQLQSDYAKLDIKLYIAACSGPVYEKFIICDQQEGIESKFMIFPTIHDAVLFAQSNVLRTKQI
ncbi:prestin isoform X2 [Tribolium castaneum]|uniref:Prestin-like Protein n=1 Tax=Tribolium castaneum TaxID=7070 RepID=D2A5I3_TRICA|nr:PREDICTED: solute carrier family 26 member 10 isoform X2 [Tribolium castaneum]XP_008201727.1 PREDICTED: solute carrier family 26 member 10 isoform X2 [Tribolium castaneum]XP_968452.1 PREDICTED: solute carrier family 26 member 10 isoform X2 [Tribolium castaneum]EFA05376.1 Prestin-like Protein [Tribolium castaneum]|eukprot:XP_008190266.1 PREDICTED: solute carrier family 26 member 10 isoform X2 [Tribolium castaneum]